MKNQTGEANNIIAYNAAGEQLEAMTKLIAVF